MTLSLHRRILLAQAPLAAALALVGAASLRTLSDLGENAKKMLRDNYRSALAAQRMMLALDGVERVALMRATGRTPPTPAAVHLARFEDELAVQRRNITEAGEDAATDRVRLAWLTFRQAADASGSAREVLAASDALRAATHDILALNEAAMVRKSERAERRSQGLLLLTLGAAAAALTAGLLASRATAARFERWRRRARFDELGDDALGAVAHELRSPLTGLRMAVELCLEPPHPPLTERQRSLLAWARQDCERLQGVVDAILERSQTR